MQNTYSKRFDGINLHLEFKVKTKLIGKLVLSLFIVLCFIILVYLHIQSFTLGNYISIDLPGEITGDFETFVTQTPLYMHEYGHYIDSQGLGSAYLAVIGIPSFLSNWDWYSRVFNLNDSDSYYTEKRANDKAAEYFKEYGVDWTEYDNDTWKYYR